MAERAPMEALPAEIERGHSETAARSGPDSAFPRPRGLSNVERIGIAHMMKFDDEEQTSLTLAVFFP